MESTNCPTRLVRRHAMIGEREGSPAGGWTRSRQYPWIRELRLYSLPLEVPESASLNRRSTISKSISRLSSSSASKNRRPRRNLIFSRVAPKQHHPLDILRQQHCMQTPPKPRIPHCHHRQFSLAIFCSKSLKPDEARSARIPFRRGICIFRLMDDDTGNLSSALPRLKSLRPI